MHSSNSHHRRKAGSGPPANALIAWIGADPRLRGTVVSGVSHRRETVLPPPAATRGARAVVAA
ncbi:MAG: hypothetical protein WAK86_02755, partial [Pseudonocardiaceae bacterium]